MKFVEEAKTIVKLVGGEKNINNLVHCATRLRFELKNEAKADKEALESLPYVMKVIASGGQYQVVIGPDVNNYYNAILSIANIGNKKDNKEETSEKKSPIDRLMKVISGAFSPLIPLLAGADMVKALLTVLVEFHILGYEDPTYLILAAAGNAVFYFLPIFLGTTLAKQFGANAYVGGAIGAALLEPNFTGLMTAKGSVNFLGIPVTPIDYASTVFPIFIAVIVYSFLEKGLKKIIKKELQLFLVPMICLMVMVPFTAIAFGPVGTTVGNVVADIVVKLFNFNKIIAGLLLAAVYPFLTIFGLHWGFTPITLQNLDQYGGDMIEGVCVCAVFAQIGIAIGAYLKGRKGSKIRSVAGPTVITGIMAGVSEPILYGIVMEYKRLMAVVAIASGLGGAINGAFGVTMDEYVFHNIFSMIMRTYSPFGAYLIGISVSLLAGALLTYFWGIRPEDMKDFVPEEDGEMLEEKPVKKTEEEIEEKEAAAKKKDIEVCAPIAGQIVALKDVPDEVFSSGVTGDGIAINPIGDTIVAPADGVISAVLPSKHAIGMTLSNGAEILVHVGLNTVMLEGKGFDAKVTEGQKVDAGEVLLTFDRALIEKAGYSLITPILVANTDEFAPLKKTDANNVNTGDSLYKIEA